MTDIDKTMLAAVAQALHGLRFGSLEIVVHEGPIVQPISPWGLTGQPEAPVFTEISRW